jgi:hypothetical protein
MYMRFTVSIAELCFRMVLVKFYLMKQMNYTLHVLRLLPLSLLLVIPLANPASAEQQPQSEEIVFRIIKILSEDGYSFDTRFVMETSEDQVTLGSDEVCRTKEGQSVQPFYFNDILVGGEGKIISPIDSKGNVLVGFVPGTIVGEYKEGRGILRKAQIAPRYDMSQQGKVSLKCPVGHESTFIMLPPNGQRMNWNKKLANPSGLDD